MSESLPYTLISLIDSAHNPHGNRYISTIYDDRIMPENIHAKQLSNSCVVPDRMLSESPGLSEGLTDNELYYPEQSLH